jgi:L-lactate dehydrogenase
VKVTIIGGAGRVGSNTAFALQLSGLFAAIALIDVMSDAAQGEALDLRHGTALAGTRTIVAGGYELLPGTDLLIITAGLRRRPEESRLDLINRNVALFRSIMAEVQAVGIGREAICFLVANPVDILTHLAADSGIFAPGRVLGLGNVLDTTRFRSLLGERFEVDPRQVQALILGEHGDSMVPIWSTATVNGVPLAAVPGFNQEVAAQVFAQTRQGGAEAIRLKGGAGYAVALSICQVAESIVRDAHAILPVSSPQHGAYGLTGVSLSVPTVVGRAGVLACIEMPLAPQERVALTSSAQVLRDTLAQVG